jgi:hypothetical protein
VGPFGARFLTRDPLGGLGEVNPYAYSRGNPISLSDPSGLSALRGSSVSDPNFNQITEQQMQDMEDKLPPEGRAWMQRIVGNDTGSRAAVDLCAAIKGKGSCRVPIFVVRVARFGRPRTSRVLCIPRTHRTVNCSCAVILQIGNGRALAKIMNEARAFWKRTSQTYRNASKTLLAREGKQWHPGWITQGCAPGGLPGLPYVAPPLLSITDSDLLNGEIPYFLISLSDDRFNYDPCNLPSIHGANNLPDRLATHARIRHLRSFRRDDSWVFWSEAAVSKARTDFCRAFTARTEADKKIFLSILLHNLTRYASKMYHLGRGVGGTDVDARIATMNELMLVASCQLSSIATEYGSAGPNYRFSEDLFDTAQFGNCEYELICACGALIWMAGGRSEG